MPFSLVAVRRVEPPPISPTSIIHHDLDIKLPTIDICLLYLIYRLTHLTSKFDKPTNEDLLFFFNQELAYCKEPGGQVPRLRSQTVALNVMTHIQMDNKSDPQHEKFVHDFLLHNIENDNIELRTSKIILLQITLISLKSRKRQ